MNKQTHKQQRIIANNKKALHDYFIEEHYQAGVVLQGWEVKSLREGRVQLKDCYVLIRENAAWLIGSHISPLATVSTHIRPDPTRSRKLLLHQRQINKLQIARDRQGYTIVALNLHWEKNRVKADIALAKGKKQFDKRQTLKQRDWQREQERLLKR